MEAGLMYEQETEKWKAINIVGECLDSFQDIEDFMCETSFDTFNVNVGLYNQSISKIDEIRAKLNKLEKQFNDMKERELEECNQPI